MFIHNETELKKNTNNNQIHIQNRSNAKNCSTSSTDSGVGLGESRASFRANPESQGKTETKAETSETETTPHQHISIEVEAKVKRRSSPTCSIRSTTISVISIDENADDSSTCGSDSEAEPTVQKLGRQITASQPHNLELTQLNKGLTVVSRQVVAGDAQGPSAVPAPDAVAQQLLSGNISLATPTTPASPPQQIGSIALSNTTDVTFGDKHYYEGPVTIQQYLIESGDKWKANGGQENPAFDAHTTSKNSASGSKLDPSCQKAPTLCPFLPHTIGRKAIVITAVIVGLIILLAVILALTPGIFGKTLKTTNDDDKELDLVSVANWGGRVTRPSLDPLKLPVDKVIIAHTVTEGCDTRDSCSKRARMIQAYHMDTLDWAQVGYNFLVGGDGRVYVGRGWDYIGAHTIKYNSISIGIAFIGNFDQSTPTEAQLRAGQLLVAQGVRLKKLSPNYQIYGHRQLIATQSPGDNLYKIIKTWPHFAKSL